MLDRFARFALSLLAVFALASFAAGCGDDDEGESGDAKAVSFELSEPQKGKYELSVPESVEAGLVEITFKNSAKGEREAQLVRIEGDRTAQDVLKAVEQSEKKGIPGFIQDGGGVGTTKGGATQKVTEVLAPGKYVAFDADASQDGAFAEFEVTGEKAEGELPKADATVTAKDYSFAPSGLKAGKSTVLFDNQGAELHHLIALPMKSGATIDQVKEFLETEKGEPPLEEEGSVETSVIDGGKKQVVSVNLRSGKYALVCFINDRKGGPPHVAKGMVNETTVR